jgi:hypothetical protein
MTMRSTSATLACVAAALSTVVILAAVADGARARGGSRITASKGAIVGNYGGYGGSCSKTRPDLCNPPKGGKAGSSYTPPSPRPGSGKSSNCQPNGTGCAKQY